MYNMTSAKIQLRHIYESAARTLYPVLENLDQESLDWRPAPESRSIGEIIRHLIRVDVWFMSQFGIVLNVTDPGETDAASLLSTLRLQHDRIAEVIANPATDPSSPHVTGTDKISKPLCEVLVHMAHHYLYHLGQIIYLRRARDRNWDAPLGLWEYATYEQGAELGFVRDL